MIPNAFEYKAAQTIKEAVSLKNEDAMILAGGHSLIPTMKLRLNQPATLIDISKIPSLKQIREKGDHISIGAVATHDDVANSEVVKKYAPMLSQGAEMIGDMQVRNAGTIGGSLAHADPAADWPAMIMASDGVVKVTGKSGSREIQANQFFVGFFETSLQEDEIITEILIPKQGPDTHSNYMKFPQPASRFAIVGCAVSLTVNNNVCNSIKLAFNGVSEAPFRDKAVENALRGQALTEVNIANASGLAAESVEILGDAFASPMYRKHLAKVFAKRAILASRP